MRCSSCKRPIPEAERARALVLPTWTTCPLCRGTRFPVPGLQVGAWLAVRGDFELYEATTTAGQRRVVGLWPGVIPRHETFDGARLERALPGLAALGDAVVRLHAWGQVGQSLYFVEEQPGGLLLGELVRGAGPVTVSSALTILSWVSGVFDRVQTAWPWAKLTPDRLVVLPGGALKLSVFSMTPFTDSLQAGRCAVPRGFDADVAYASPEELEDTSVLSPSRRVYATGALASFLLTGRPPFVERTTREYLRKIRDEVPAPLRQLRADVPAALSSLVARCLSKKPEDRPRDLAAVAAALAQVRPTA